MTNDAEIVVTATDQDRVLVHRNLGKPAGELFGDSPVRGHAPAVEQTCGGEEESTAAHRAIAPDPRGLPPQPADDDTIGGHPGRVRAARDEKRVDGLIEIAIDDAVRHQPHA